MPSRRRASSNGPALEGPEEGGNGLGRAHVAGIQRTRMLAAMVEVVAEHGFGEASVGQVVARSGVSRRTFYEIFEDREDCFLAAFDVAIDRIAATVVPIYQRAGKWRERIRAALAALLDLLDYEQAIGRLVIAEALAAGPNVLGRRRRALTQVIAAVEEARSEAKSREGPPPLTAEGIVGGVFSLIHSRMLEEESSPLLELLNPLMSMIVLPYLGPAAAQRELSRPTPKLPPRASRPPADPLRGLDMRLTYRTMRVLMAVAQAPGASNRKLAEASGVSDQGQISKLLMRLTNLGLLEKAGIHRVRGEPNAWRLTAKGRQVESAFSGRAAATGSDLALQQRP